MLHLLFFLRNIVSYSETQKYAIFQYSSAFHAFITNLRISPYGVRIPLSLLYFQSPCNTGTFFFYLVYQLLYFAYIHIYHFAITVKHRFYIFIVQAF